MPESSIHNDVGNTTLESERESQRWQLVLKVVGPCNLNCDYCYVYNMADSSWRDQPKFMADETIDRVAERMSEHCTANGQDTFDVTLHGGEPLMMGSERLERTLTALSQVAPDKLRFGVQTNATLLNEEILDLFLDYNVAVGVSLDGDRQGNRHRLYRDGRESYDKTMAGIELLHKERYKRLFSGLLAVVDIRNHPEDTYDHLAGLAPPNMDFLLPHGNWDAPPPGKSNVMLTPYAYWLASIFNKWYEQPAAERPPVRTFHSVMRSLRGQAPLVEALGLSPVREITIQTDGSYEQVDTLQSTYHGAAHLGMHVLRHSLGEVMSHPKIHARTLGIAALREQLPAVCQTCPPPIADACGAGYEPHRYSEHNGFDNPSVYCTDLTELIAHIATRMKKDEVIAAALRNTGDLNRLRGEAFEV